MSWSFHDYYMPCMAWRSTTWTPGLQNNTNHSLTRWLLCTKGLQLVQMCPACRHDGRCFLMSSFDSPGVSAGGDDVAELCSHSAYVPAVPRRGGVCQFPGRAGRPALCATAACCRHGRCCCRRSRYMSVAFQMLHASVPAASCMPVLSLYALTLP